MIKKNCFKFLFSLTIFTVVLCQKTTALSYSDVDVTLSNIFYNSVDRNEGQTTFRSLLIPFGGRTESLAGAYTGLCDDIGYLRYNPGGGAIQKETQMALFHNSWIADSKLDTLAYTTRFKKIPNLSWGSYLSCFYVPFTEYNIFGDRVAGNYYSETVAAINGSYNFLAGYDFKGFSLGGTIKSAWRNMPDYTNNDTNQIIQNSGIKQSGLAVMADLGVVIQFNFLKFYASRDPNVRIGLSAQNVGVSITGFGDKIQHDDGLPTTFAAGMSLKLLNPITLTAEISQPFNFSNPGAYLTPYLSTGVAFQFTSFLTVLGGFGIKGGNPKFSAGFEFEVQKVRFNANYTLDFTSSFSPFNKFSLSVKIMLGDKGRSIVDAQVDELYQQGLIYYADTDYQSAIDVWNEALKLNKRFDPAKIGIQSAQHQIDMFRKIKESLMLEQN